MLKINKKLRKIRNQFFELDSVIGSILKTSVGFGDFTYSKSHINKVVKYVLNQPIHHQKQSFKDEYLLLLEKFEVDYDLKYVFEWYD